MAIFIPPPRRVKNSWKDLTYEIIGFEQQTNVTCVKLLHPYRGITRSCYPVQSSEKREKKINNVTRPASTTTLHIFTSSPRVLLLLSPLPKSLVPPTLVPFPLPVRSTIPSIHSIYTYYATIDVRIANPCRAVACTGAG